MKLSRRNPHEILTAEAALNVSRNRRYLGSPGYHDLSVCLAEDEDMIRCHAEPSGSPADKITKVGAHDRSDDSRLTVRVSAGLRASVQATRSSSTPATAASKAAMAAVFEVRSPARGA